MYLEEEKQSHQKQGPPSITIALDIMSVLDHTYP